MLVDPDGMFAISLLILIFIAGLLSSSSSFAGNGQLAYAGVPNISDDEKRNMNNNDSGLNPVPALLAGTVILVGSAASVVVELAKASKTSQSARATNAPSWSLGEPPRGNETAQEYATRILDEKYGQGNWKKGANSEYSRIVKRAQRHLGLK